MMEMSQKKKALVAAGLAGAILLVIFFVFFLGKEGIPVVEETAEEVHGPTIEELIRNSSVPPGGNGQEWSVEELNQLVEQSSAHGGAGIRAIDEETEQELIRRSSVPQ